MGCKLLTKTAVTHYSRALTLDFYTTAPMLIYADPPSPTTRAVRRPADPPPMVASPPLVPGTAVPLRIQSLGGGKALIG